MFTVNEDLSIYATRGDMVFFSVSADGDNGVYHFQPGDILRIKVFEKKEPRVVIFQKDFPVAILTDTVDIVLTPEETKIGDVISKPKDYWYEVELNPLTNPQTIVGYDEYGPRVFRLFPEGADIDVPYTPSLEDFPVVDENLDLTSPRPVSNSAIARAIAKLDSESKNYHISPQMFGAAGDGVTDDTVALQSMIAYADTHAPVREFPNEATSKDYTHISMKFDGQYLITEPINFNQTYGVKIEGLNLIAGTGFSGLGMLMFDGNTRCVSVSNTTINGQFNADTCLYIDDYTLTTDFVNVEMTQFKKYGFFADAKGHEIKMNNVRIAQAEWGRKDELASIVDEGTGLYMGEERHDNNLTNVVVSYCHSKTIDIYGSANTLVNCHFYGGNAYNNGLWNVFQNCYFDCIEFHTMGFFTLANCFFNRSAQVDTPFIFLMEASTNEWRYYQAAINGTMFRSVYAVTNVIDLGALSEIPQMNTIGNTFYNVEPFVAQSKNVALNPWMRPYKHTGENEHGYVCIADVKFIWGTANANGFQEYPEGVTLTHTFYIGVQREDGTSEIHPYANDIRSNKFYLNGTANGKCKWLVIGR